MPIFVQNVQQYILKRQFLIGYSIISQAVKRGVVDLGYLPDCWYWDNGHFSNYNLPSSGQGYFSECASFKKVWLNNLKIIKTCKEHSLDNGCIPEYKGWNTLQFEQNPDFEETDLCSNEFKAVIEQVHESYVLSNGMILINLITGGSHDMVVFALDVNGKKKPNKWGYDLFELALWSNIDKSIYIRHGYCQPTDIGGRSVSDMLIKEQ